MAYQICFYKCAPNCVTSMINIPITGYISGTTLCATAGTPIIGQSIYGTGVCAGTIVLSGSGTQWTVNISQSAGGTSTNQIQMFVNNTYAAVQQCMRSLEIYGCTPDLTQGEFNDCCIQGTYVPSGSCCAWTVPTGVCRISVELWGAGAGGASGSCITHGLGGGGGGYIKKTIAVVPNDIITFCAGAGSLMGQSGGKTTQGVGLTNCFCCATRSGSCSFVMRNGTMCADTAGGKCALTQGYYACFGVGSIDNVGADLGSNYTAVQSYTAEVYGTSGEMVTACVPAGAPYYSPSISGSTAFGSDSAINVFQTQCNQYLRWNITCRNSAGIFGPGGDSCSGSTAFNVGLNYGCMTCSCCTWSCDRGRAAPPGNFPGGGGAGGTMTLCAGYSGAGGNGAPGYIRVYY